MGLDNYWECENPPEFNPPLVIGWRYDENLPTDKPGEDNNTEVLMFRGKLYDSVITSITKISLYTDKIENKHVRTMAKQLTKASQTVSKSAKDYYFFGNYGFIDSQTLEELARMFTEYGNTGGILHSWY